jgi:hypothetical protein
VGASGDPPIDQALPYIGSVNQIEALDFTPGRADAATVFDDLPLPPIPLYGAFPGSVHR